MIATVVRPRFPDPYERRQRHSTRMRSLAIVGAVVAPPVSQMEAIDLGTCVRVSLSGGHSRLRMHEEGVVIEVVPPDGKVRSARVAYLKTPKSTEPRYVVQCWSRRVLRNAADLLVVSP